MGRRLVMDVSSRQLRTPSHPSTQTRRRAVPLYRRQPLRTRSACREATSRGRGIEQSQAALAVDHNRDPPGPDNRGFESSAWRRNVLTRKHIGQHWAFFGERKILGRGGDFAHIQNHGSADGLEIGMAEFQSHAAADEA